MAQQKDRMFGIKLIHPNHLKYPWFTDDFDGSDGRQTLMNFSADGIGPALAANIPVGHQSLVYVIHEQKFIWAIEYIGSVSDGLKAAASHRISPDDKWRVFRPIRFLAKVDLKSAPTLDDIHKRTGILFKPNSFTMTYITQSKYQTLFDAINWAQKE